MWLLSFITPPPNASADGPGDWIPFVMVAGLIAAIMAVAIVAGNRGRQAAGGPSQSEHHDLAA